MQVKGAASLGGAGACTRRDEQAAGGRAAQGAPPDA
jgi:hypothetical protein